jgi:hypothetical protein
MRRSNAKRVRIFCTECGEALDNFWLESDSGNIKQIIQRMAKCKAEGRFHGNFCARLWIAGNDSFARPRNTRKFSTRKIAALKSSINRRITAEARRSSRSRKKGS